MGARLAKNLPGGHGPSRSSLVHRRPNVKKNGAGEPACPLRGLAWHPPKKPGVFFEKESSYIPSGACTRRPAGGEWGGRRRESTRRAAKPPRPKGVAQLRQRQGRCLRQVRVVGAGRVLPPAVGMGAECRGHQPAHLARGVPLGPAQRPCRAQGQVPALLQVVQGASVQEPDEQALAGHPGGLLHHFGRIGGEFQHGEQSTAKSTRCRRRAGGRVARCRSARSPRRSRQAAASM
jgi:hypothetical protein